MLLTDQPGARAGPLLAARRAAGALEIQAGAEATTLPGDNEDAAIAVGGPNSTVRTVSPPASDTTTGLSDTVPLRRRIAISPLMLTSWVRCLMVAMRSHVASAVYRAALRLTAANQLPRQPAGVNWDGPLPLGVHQRHAGAERALPHF